MLEQKIKLKMAMEKNEPLSVVKDLFIDYKEAFNRLRKPSSTHNKDYEILYNKYVEYEKKKNGK